MFILRDDSMMAIGNYVWGYFIVLNFQGSEFVRIAIFDDFFEFY